METVADNAYVAYRSVRGRFRGTLWPPDVDPLCAVLLRKIWVNGSSVGVANLRAELALPRSTLSTALLRLERRGYVRRRSNVVDRRYIDVVLTKPGERVASAVTELIVELEFDVEETAGGQARFGFGKVARMLATMDEEMDG
jgi:DNA-binding MarR family transcriptional regulator